MTSSPALTNCILWNNAANSSTTTSSASVKNISSIPTYSHCLIATFTLLHPTLDPHGDANGNRITNYNEYAAGFDPAALPDLVPRPFLTGHASSSLFFTFTRRTNAGDVFTSFEKAPDMASWSPMISGVHYDMMAASPVVPGREQVTIRLLFNPAVDPKIFWRSVYSTSN